MGCSFASSLVCRAAATAYWAEVRETQAPGSLGSAQLRLSLKSLYGTGTCEVTH